MMQVISISHHNDGADRQNGQRLRPALSASNAADLCLTDGKIIIFLFDCSYGLPFCV